MKVITSGRWQVSDLELTPEKLEVMWQRLQKYRSLFSDLSRGDKQGWIDYITSPDTFWFEVTEKDGGGAVGMVYFQGFQKGTEIEGHMVYFDRKPAEKIEVTRDILNFMFKSFPIQRIVVEIPHIYRATYRLLERLGFKKEGRKREAVLLGGTWQDTFIFGLTRRDAWETSVKASAK